MKDKFSDLKIYESVNSMCEQEEKLDNIYSEKNSSINFWRMLGKLFHLINYYIYIYLILEYCFLKMQ